MNVISLKTKKVLFKKCCDLIQERIAMLRHLLLEVQEAVNEEQKSSSGDKYETGRAMMQLEQEKAETQLEEALKIKMILNRIDISVKNDSVQTGTIVFTDNGIFFMAVALGNVNCENVNYYVISPFSPIGMAFMNKKVGENIMVNNRGYLIENIY